MDYSPHVKESVIDMLMFNALKLDATISDKHAAIGFWNWVLKTYFFRHHSYNIMHNAPCVPGSHHTLRLDFAIQMLPEISSERGTDYLLMGMGCTSFASEGEVALMEEALRNQADIFIDTMREPSIWLMTFIGPRVRLWAYQKYKLVPLFPNDSPCFKVDGYFDIEMNRKALQNAFSFLKCNEPRIYIREYEAAGDMPFEQKRHKVYSKLGAKEERSTKNNRMNLVNSGTYSGQGGESSTSNIGFA